MPAAASSAAKSGRVLSSSGSDFFSRNSPGDACRRGCRARRPPPGSGVARREPARVGQHLPGVVAVELAAALAGLISNGPYSFLSLVGVGVPLLDAELRRRSRSGSYGEPFGASSRAWTRIWPPETNSLFISTRPRDAFTSRLAAAYRDSLTQNRS